MSELKKYLLEYWPVKVSTKCYWLIKVGLPLQMQTWRFVRRLITMSLEEFIGVLVNAELSCLILIFSILNECWMCFHLIWCYETLQKWHMSCMSTICVCKQIPHRVLIQKILRIIWHKHWWRIGIQNKNQCFLRQVLLISFYMCPILNMT